MKGPTFFYILFCVALLVMLTVTGAWYRSHLLTGVEEISVPDKTPAAHRFDLQAVRAR